MLEGEPSWLVVFEPAADSLGSPARPGLSFRSTGSDHTLHVELGEEAHRPAIAERDDTAVILDGFLLDHTLLASAIGSRRGIEGDAALILAGYLELGQRVLPLLRGSFGVIIWDGRRDTIWCARDPTDSHPLFFSRTDGRVLISASHGALLGAGGVRASLDRVDIARWVVLGTMLPGRTFYDRIERLPPGCVLTAAADGAGVRRYWHPRDKAPTGEITPKEAIRRFEELLDQAVARCATLGRLGVLLSGGVDSAVVAASAAVVSRGNSLRDPLALSYVYPDPDASEEAAQRGVASALGIPHRIVPLLDLVGPEGLLAAALRLTERSWMPCLNPWEPASMQLAEQAAEHGSPVILSGEGGNDWFQAQWYEAADLIRRLRLLRLFRLWSQERRAGRGGWEMARTLAWSYGGRVLVRDAAVAALRQVAEGALQAVQGRRVLSSIPGGWALPDEGLRTALVDEFLEQRSSRRLGNYRDSANERELESVSLVVPMENRFLFSRSAGVHFLNPAVDPDLVAFLYGLPSALLNLNGRGKGLAWESARRRAGEQPARLLGLATLEGFLASLVRGDGPRALERLGGLRELSELGIVDAAAFAKALEGPGLGVEIGYHDAWRALAGEAWVRKVPKRESS
jgi:asparagine synthase (glutamine-hydrolysing)